MNNQELQVILDEHKKWVCGEGGTKANLSGVDLSGFDLSGADLRYAYLRYANLRWANLTGAFLIGANLREVNLKGADLTDADLRGADLNGANLLVATICNATGNGREIKSFRIFNWPIVWTKDQLAIGCQKHSIEDWKSFDDEQIDKMHGDALEWWREHQNFIFNLVKG